MLDFVDVMYIDNTTKHMSMHASNVRKASGRLNVVSPTGVCGLRRGMLSRPSDGGGGGVHGAGEVGRGVDHTVGRGLSGRSDKGGCADEAGTSRSRGARAGRGGGGGSISESD